jgi:predicted N-acetyltransferase YhbS
MSVVDGVPAGHVLFTRAVVSGAEAGITASNLAPLAVIPEFQGRGLGGELIRNGLRQLAEMDTDLVFVLGHPGYYRRFGFRPAGALGLIAPYPIPPQHADAWMVQELKEGTVGTVEGRIICANSLNKPEYWVE